MRTVFLGIRLLDRYLADQQIVRDPLKMLGLSGMRIAAKFEGDAALPSLEECLDVTENAHSTSEFHAMEMRMLTRLGFGIAGPTAAHFFDLHRRSSAQSDVHRHVLQHILELTLTKQKFACYPPSHLTAAAALLTNVLLNDSDMPIWPQRMADATRYSEPSLLPCVEQLRSAWEEPVP